MARPKKVAEMDNEITNAEVVFTDDVEVKNPKDVKPKPPKPQKKVEILGDNISPSDPYEIKEEKQEKVRIRMREDHQCTIAMVRYSFKKGRCYDVPPNVKNILNKRGLLDPL